jgi:hypothetical protein
MSGLRRRRLRVAQVAPLAESVPPELYGGTERVVSWLTEELVHRQRRFENLGEARARMAKGIAAHSAKPRSYGCVCCDARPPSRGSIEV